MLPLFLGLSGVRSTNAYYGDIESSLDNILSAAFLDLLLTNNNLEKIIGPEALGEVSHASVVMEEEGSLAMQYALSNSVLNEDADLCSKLIVEAKLNGISKYIGPLSLLAHTATTEFGSWEFRFDLPPNASVPHGAKCHANALFSTWRQDIVNLADSGWNDKEILDISFTARMVVLNEIFARPNGGPAPKDKEYIELYNNGNTPVDVLNWKISEISGVTETFYPIVAVGAVPGQVMPYNGASTVIPAGGFLVLQFGGGSSHLNDTGDTVKLYDNTAVLLDGHSYPAIAAGKAVVRFPDGIGFWVDPEPTPGTTNMVSLEDLRLAGFTDDMIEEVMKLAVLMNATWSTENEKLEEQEVIPVTETAIELITTGSTSTTIEGALEEILQAVETLVESTILPTPEPELEPEPQPEAGQPSLEASADTEVLADETVGVAEVVTNILEIVETLTETVITEETPAVIEETPQPSPEATAGEAEPAPAPIPSAEASGSSAPVEPSTTS